MGMSTDGHNCFGILFPEDHPFPWENDEEEEWWEEHGPGGPLPVEFVNVCSAEYPHYVIAVPSTPSTSLIANRGYPQAFDPSALTVTQEETEVLIRFCQDHCLSEMDLVFDKPVDLTPKWYLGSYLG